MRADGQQPQRPIVGRFEQLAGVGRQHRRPDVLARGAGPLGAEVGAGAGGQQAVAAQPEPDAVTGRAPDLRGDLAGPVDADQDPALGEVGPASGADPLGESRERPSGRCPIGAFRLGSTLLSRRRRSGSRPAPCAIRRGSPARGAGPGRSAPLTIVRRGRGRRPVRRPIARRVGGAGAPVHGQVVHSSSLEGRWLAVEARNANPRVPDPMPGVDHDSSRSRHQATGRLRAGPGTGRGRRVRGEASLAGPGPPGTPGRSGNSGPWPPAMLTVGLRRRPQQASRQPPRQGERQPTPQESRGGAESSGVGQLRGAIRVPRPPGRPVRGSAAGPGEAGEIREKGRDPGVIDLGQQGRPPLGRLADGREPGKARDPVAVRTDSVLRNTGFDPRPTRFPATRTPAPRRAALQEGECPNMSGSLPGMPSGPSADFADLEPPDKPKSCGR